MSELVKWQQVAAANSEAKSLWEALGVRAASEPRIFRGLYGVFLPPPLYFVPGYKKYPSFTNLRTCLKKDHFLREICNAGATHLFT